MKKTVVSFADNNRNYAKSMRRLENSLKSVGFDGEFCGFSSYAEIGSPLHSEIPYAFKPYSISKCVHNGSELILWCDSPVYAIGDISPIFDHIEKHGYLFFNNIGYSVGDYTSDECLEKFKISREEAFEIPMIMACVMGFNIKNNTAGIFLSEYLSYLNYYRGSWTNHNNEVSKDDRCFGHRHDQSVASLIIHEMGLDITTGNETYFMYTDHLKYMQKADSVCLLSQGM